MVGNRLGIYRIMTEGRRSHGNAIKGRISRCELAWLRSQTDWLRLAEES